MAPVVFLVTLVVFLSARLVPGGPVEALTQGRRMSPEAIERFRVDLGLDQPWYVQYWKWAGKILSGDFGTSIRSRRLVVVEILYNFPHTVELVFASLLLAVPFGILLGVYAALKQHSVFDYFCTTLSVVGVSMPAFWLALMLMLLFSVWLGWLPTSGLLDPRVALKPITHFHLLDALITRNFVAIGDFFHHLVLPSVVLATIPLAYITRMVRSSMLDVLRLDYVSVARAKGVPETRVILKHALRNALIPVTIVIGTVTGLLLGGAILTETIFGLPGMGRLIVESILDRDFPVIQACVLVFALSYSLVTLLTDITCQLIDPKARYD